MWILRSCARSCGSGAAADQQPPRQPNATAEATRTHAAEREQQPVADVTDPSAPAPAAALAPPRTLPLRIAALEEMWSTNATAAVASTSYLARVDALEALVTGGERGQGALPTRVAALERHSGE